MIQIFNEDCFETMKRINGVDIVLTSPPYNINCNIRGFKMYDEYRDTKTENEYVEWTTSLFKEFDRIISPNGVVLYNLSYSHELPNLIWKVLANVTSETCWNTVETITWKKPNATPNNSRQSLTRICELVFVFARNNEMKTFNINKHLVDKKGHGKTFYNTDFYNFIEAPNNDGVNWLNKATYSTLLCEQLLNIYALPKSVVYDPFMGTGTTAVACKKLGLDCYGSEISKQQVDYSLERLGETTEEKPIGKFEFDI